MSSSDIFKEYVGKEIGIHFGQQFCEEDDNNDHETCVDLLTMGTLIDVKENWIILGNSISNRKLIIQISQIIYFTDESPDTRLYGGKKILEVERR